MKSSKVDAFCEAVAPFLSLYQSVEVGVVTIQAEAEWRNIRTQCTLRAEPADALVPRHRPVESAIVRTIHVALPISDLRLLLDDVSRGAWVADGTAIRYLTSHFGVDRTPYVLSDEHFFDLRNQWRHPAFPWSGYVLHGGGDACQEIIARVPGDWTALERVARRSPHAAADIDAIASEFTGVGFSLGSYCTVFELYAPLAARLAPDRCRLDRSGVRFALEAESRAAAQACQLHVTALREPERHEDDTRTLSAFEWTGVRGLYTASATLKLAGASAARLKLSMGPEVVHQIELTAQPRAVTAGRRSPARASGQGAYNHVAMQVDPPSNGATAATAQLPRVGTARESAQGVAILSELVHRPPTEGGLGWIFRHQVEADVGIDGHIEVVGTPAEPHAVTGRFVAVQVKAGASFFVRGDGAAWSVRLRRSTVHYWCGLSVPVLVVLVDLKDARCYWVHVASPPPHGSSATVRIRVPCANRLSSASGDAIRALAYSARQAAQS